jgi:LmbE family N-acetylglucosaminyl deacetylase
MAFHHVYLSPHPDDAALACAGLIRQQVAAGKSVLVVNVFAGIPDYRRLSAFARELHARWGGAPDPVAARRTEDQVVLTGLGATVEHWDFLDCIYRGQDDTWFYPSRDDLFGPVHPAESNLLLHVALRLARLRGEHEAATFYAPLGAGHHVDHQIVRAGTVALARLGADVVFYEDFPYVGETDALDQARAELGLAGWQHTVVPVDPEAKIQAIAGYASQVPVLFGDAAQMADQVRAYARLVMGDEPGHGERLWWMV